MEELLYSGDWIFIFRVIVAGICGAAIGFERERKQKSAGFRTHIIIAMASALMVIISKYGFDDVLGTFVRVDPSRVAAGVVTAIGFIGSGVIFMREKFVTGLTTSAGIWATVGVGMSIGAGMYQLGCVTSLLIIIVEIFVGKVSAFIPKIRNRITLTVESENKVDTATIVDILEAHNTTVEGIEYKKQKEKGYKIKFHLNIHSIKGRVSQIVDEVKDKDLVDSIYVKK